MIDNVKTIEEYYRCFKDRDRNTLAKILSPNLRHKSPWATFTDRDKMLDEIWPMVGKVWATDLKIFSDGSDYIVYYKHSGDGNSQLVERIGFSGDQIDRIEVYPEHKGH